MRRTTLLATAWTAFIFAVYLLISVLPARPATIYDGDVCFKCRRLIDDARLAAESLDRSLPTKYRTPSCLAAYVAQHPSPDARYFVTDFVSGGLFEADRAYFVPVLVNDRTGERDYRAYHSQRLADAAARELGVQTVRWPDLIANARAKA